jgi:CubicO group peptidase (beta-lactamase class C family)
MKIFLSIFGIIAMANIAAQKITPAVADRIKQVENNLRPDIVYGDSIPKLNLLQQMAAYKVNGLTIAVIKDYKIDWTKGYGWADAEEKRPVIVDTRFQAASISKSVNSLGILKLVQQEKLNLDADINDYLKTWKFPYDSVSRSKKITVANLLSHTAGLSVHGFGGYSPGDSIPTLPQILNGSRPANSRAVRSLFEPSKRFQYSGGGTTISQLVLMDITGSKYEDYMKKEVLLPIGMTNSSYEQPPATGTKNLATGYNNGITVKGKYHIYPEQAAAGLWTTPTDLAKYIIETQLAFEGKSAKVLSQAMMQKRLTHYIDSNVALGVFLVKKSGDVYFNHNGGNEGFLCTSYGSLEGGNGVVVMINASDFSIINEVVNSVATVYNWKDFYKPVFKKLFVVSPDSLSNYAGKFLLGKDTLAVSICGENLCIQQNGQPADGYRMMFTSGTEFTVKEVPDATLRFLYKEGKVDGLEINQGGMKIPAKKIN